MNVCGLRIGKKSNYMTNLCYSLKMDDLVVSDEFQTLCFKSMMMIVVEARPTYTGNIVEITTNCNRKLLNPGCRSETTYATANT